MEWSQVYAWIVLPGLIFLARAADVSIGTLRVVFVARGARHLAPILGFCEILIWILVIGQIVKNLDNAACYVAYAGGFATGTFVGLLIERRLSLGTIVLRVIAPTNASELAGRMRSEGHGVTTVGAEGTGGAVQIIYSVVKRYHLKRAIELVRELSPESFYTVEDVRAVGGPGVFQPGPSARERIFGDPRSVRKEK
jgi:uncharacterized protein YebE (UPF0316 family)